MNGYLILETGESYQGTWNGGQARAGEVVFNTSHSGYEEIATDPSYMSQIVLLTAPMQGNYGIDKSVWESRKLWIEGFISLQISKSKRENSWLDLLNKNGIPVLTELDTRVITLRLRHGGTPWGALVQADSVAKAHEIAKELIAQKKKQDLDWVHLTSRLEIEIRKGHVASGPSVAVLDLGAKENIIRELQKRCRQVTIFPSRSIPQVIMDSKPDGLMLTNGPGDPADVKVSIETVRSLLGKLPIFGICMGHQILGLALGGSTYKLRFGHRGCNQPIRDEILGRVYMSSQNHGYAVKSESLPKDVVVTHTNLNDLSVAGFFSQERNLLGIQYHPESHPGPHEATELFDFFIHKMISLGCSKRPEPSLEDSTSRKRVQL